MEYLMTYGWAILIVAVVLGALYSLGIFNGSNFLGGTCVAAPGYLCSNPLLATDGTLSLTYGYQGPNVTVVGFACTNTTTAPSSFASSGSSNLEPGQEESVSVSCPLPSGATIGTPYSGYLWVEYDQAGQSNLIARFATARLTASVAAGVDMYMYVAAANYIYVVSTANYLITDTIPVGAPLSNMYLDKSDGMAYGYYEDNIYTIDTSKNEVTNVLTMPSQVQQMAVDPSGGEIFTVSNAGNELYAISVSNYAIIGSKSIVRPFSVAVDPNGDYVYVSAGGSCESMGGSVYVLSSSSFATLNTITMSFLNCPVETIVEPNSENLYITENGCPSGHIISLSNDVVLSPSPQLCGGEGLGTSISPDSEYLYAGIASSFNKVFVSNYIAQSVAEASDNLLQSAISPNGNTIAFSDWAHNVVDFYNTSTTDQVAQVTMPTTPMGIVYVTK